MPGESPPIARDLAVISLESRMKSAYLDYAMSVIVGRALPCARDGLKPVHRRILYAMRELGNDWNKPFKKSARVVGDVLGKYHPHSQDAVYDALVRMAQPFSMGMMLVDGQGNFGSIDGDNAAAMRYTEVRMERIAHTMLDELDKETVDFIDNYDASSKEPVVLPAQFPNLLVNGASGIAVGMATNIPPHNLGETLDACLHLLKYPQASVDDLMRHIPAPDFPTKALICGTEGITKAYRTGRGRVVMRARTHFEEKKDRCVIVVDELPYQVNKAVLVSRIAQLSRDKKITGITDLRDESDRRGIRVVVELRRGENEQVILNRLYKETSLQEVFSVNMVALLRQTPRLMNLREIVEAFLSHRREIVIRRTVFNLRKSRARAHVLEGYALAVDNIEEIIAVIRSAKTPAEAEVGLLARAWPAYALFSMLARLDDATLVRPLDETTGGVEQGDGDLPCYRFSRTQARAILDLRLARLTQMERDKISADYNEVVDTILALLALLGDPNRVRGEIARELRHIKQRFAIARCSEIVDDATDIDEEALITREEVVVTMSHAGYIKRQVLSDYRTQHRGGRGKQAATTREDDFVANIFVANTHDYLLILTSRGRLHWKKVYELPESSFRSRGSRIAGLLQLQDGEQVQTVLAVSDFFCNRFVIMATAKGIVKKTSLDAFSNPRRGGIIAVNLDEDDSLVSAAIVEEGNTILLLSCSGKAVHFCQSRIRSVGRPARGVRGMTLSQEAKVVAMLVLPRDSKGGILIATQHGYGKRTPIGEFVLKIERGGRGVRAINMKTGPVVGATIADDNDELMLITDSGVLVRTKMDSIRSIGRNTTGVRLINLDEGSTLASVARIAPDPDKEDETS